MPTTCSTKNKASPGHTMAKHAMTVNETHHQHDEPQDDNTAHTTVLKRRQKGRQQAAVTDNTDQVSDLQYLMMANGSCPDPNIEACNFGI